MQMKISDMFCGEVTWYSFVSSKVLLLSLGEVKKLPNLDFELKFLVF